MKAKPITRKHIHKIVTKLVDIAEAGGYTHAKGMMILGLEQRQPKIGAEEDATISGIIKEQRTSNILKLGEQMLLMNTLLGAYVEGAAVHVAVVELSHTEIDTWNNAEPRDKLDPIVVEFKDGYDAMLSYKNGGVIRTLLKDGKPVCKETGEGSTELEGTFLFGEGYVLVVVEK